jgi:hypothetical protein
LQVVLVIATIALAWLLPGEAYLENLTRQRAASTPETVVEPGHAG